MKLEKIEPTIKKNNKRDLYYSNEIEKELKDLREISTFYSIYKFKDTLYAMVGWCDGSLEAISILPDTPERICLSPYSKNGYSDITTSEALEYFAENLLGAEEYMRINQPNILNTTNIDFIDNMDRVIKLKNNEEYIVFQINVIGEKYFIDKCIYKGFEVSDKRNNKKLVFNLVNVNVKDSEVKLSVVQNNNKLFIFKKHTEKLDSLIKSMINEVSNNYLYLNKKDSNKDILDYVETFVKRLRKILKNSI